LEYGGLLKKKQAITSLRQAIANEALDKKAENARELGLDYEPVQAEKQEPVAHPTEDMVLALRGASGLGTEDAIDALRDVLAVMPLYTTPQTQREWVGLTDGLKVILIKNAPNWTVIQLIEETEQLLKDQNS
jgi:hypothetical protein